MKTIAFTYLAVFFASISAFGQIEIKGVVRDNLGEPIVGVAINELDSKNKAISGLDGDFAINLTRNNSKIKFSFIGFKDTIVIVDTLKSNTIDFKFAVDSSRLINEELRVPIFKSCLICRPPDYISFNPFYSTDKVFGLNASQHNILHIISNDYIKISRFYTNFTYYKETNTNNYLLVQFSPIEFFPFSSFSGDLLLNYNRFNRGIRNIENYYFAYEYFPQMRAISGNIGFGYSKENGNSKPLINFGIGYNRRMYLQNILLSTDFTVIDKKWNSSFQIWYSIYKRRILIGGLYNNYFNYETIGVGMKFNLYYYAN